MIEAPEQSRRLTLSRHYKAPRELVWSVWTDPKHVAAWWGPFGPEHTQCEIEAIVGGTFLVAMTAPDGSKHPSRGLIKEFDPPGKLVIEGDARAPDACGAGLPPGAIVTVLLTEEDGGTRLTVDALFPSEAALKAANESGYVASWNETLASLEPFLEEITV